MWTSSLNFVTIRSGYDYIAMLLFLILLCVSSIPCLAEHVKYEFAPSSTPWLQYNAFLNIINVFSPCKIAYLTIPHGLVRCTGVCACVYVYACTHQNVLTYLSLQKPGKKVLQYCVCVQLEVMHKSVQKKTSFMTWSLFFNRNTLGQAQWVAEEWRYTLHV